MLPHFFHTFGKCSDIFSFFSIDLPKSVTTLLQNAVIFFYIATPLLTPSRRLKLLAHMPHKTAAPTLLKITLLKNI